MAFLINKAVTLPVTPFQHSVDMPILKATEKLVGQRLDWVEFKEIKSDDPRKRRFIVERAFNYRDK